ncbi:hypothetical protein [Demequina aestuarii]|nr:hypothetical protein [Demequina aestuarii]
MTQETTADSMSATLTACGVFLIGVNEICLSIGRSHQPTPR